MDKKLQTLAVLVCSLAFIGIVSAGASFTPPKGTQLPSTGLSDTITSKSAAAGLSGDDYLSAYGYNTTYKEYMNELKGNLTRMAMQITQKGSESDIQDATNALAPIVEKANADWSAAHQKPLPPIKA